MQTKEGNELGKVKIHHEAISTIAGQVVSGIPGVVKMSGSIVENIAERLGKKAPDKGIKTEVVGEEVKVEVAVVVRYRTKIPEVAWQIQKNVRKVIEEMTGLHVTGVNVNVEGVQLPKEEEEIQGVQKKSPEKQEDEN